MIYTHSDREDLINITLDYIDEIIYLEDPSPKLLNHSLEIIRENLHILGAQSVRVLIKE